MKSRVIKQLDQISYLCVAVTVAFQAAALDWVLTELPKHQGKVLLGGALSSLGLYTGLYKLLVYLYRAFGWKLLNRQFLVSGKWTTEITKSKGMPSKLYGELIIRQSFDHLEIEAKNFTENEMKTLWSIWNSTNAWFEGSVMKLSWSVKLSNGTRATGSLDLHLDGKKPPKEMHGVFYDDNPSDSKGQLKATKVSS